MCMAERANGMKKPTHYREIGDGYSPGSFYPMNWTGRTKVITGGPYPGTWYENRRKLLFWTYTEWVPEHRVEEFEPEQVEIRGQAL